MYNWYRQATVCYVLLHDWERRFDSKLIAGTYLGRSSWFRRGWTLQELFAPQDVRFFDANYDYIGSKIDLQDHISNATGIDNQYLVQPSLVQKTSIAERMEWASKRRTTREEDLAYCLLGLFGVNMPLLYGEGEKAFVRLQLEIIRKSTDESIFAWKRNTTPWDWEGLLAPSPAAFDPRWHDSCTDSRWRYTFHRRVTEPRFYRHPYSMTNRGLEFTFDASSDYTQLLTTSSRILLPRNCVEIPRYSDGSVKYRAAVRFRIQGGVSPSSYGGGNAMLVDTITLDPGTGITPGEFDADGDHECQFVVGVESGDSVRTWKIYFPQSGL